ncbi:flagellar hook-length control protein FliK [Vogesella indigofera]|uniref:flagellar hook-length control protein FliK n=1 Tax=Vogesella indigofera TaxID=45465 RepID=UPI00234E999B|nr:flagellar hook-length control protein FliK [Vogesella indigofera]MDC7699790.1 flagellar hook-length control protein FliK [Vogesella indigofera]
MAITVQSVLNLSDSSATPSQGYVSTPDSPFAMFFANQLQAFTLGQPGVVAAGDSALLDGIGQQPRAATAAAQDASLLLGGLFMPGNAATNPLTSAAGKEAAALSSLSDPAALGEALAAEELAALAGAKTKATKGGETAGALSELAALTGDAAADEAPALPGLLAAASSDKRVQRALKDDGLSAAVAVRLAMREAEAAEAGSEVKTLPPALAAGRQELPTDLSATGAGAGKELKEVLLGGTMDRSKQWGEAFGQQVVKAVERQLDSARFHVTPEKLGPIEVQISMNKEQAQIVVTTSNLMAKEIVESHLPTLSRMMEQAGLQLADAQVSSQQQGQQQHGQQAQQQRGRAQSEAMLPLTELESAAPAAAISSGLSVTA